MKTVKSEFIEKKNFLLLCDLLQEENALALIVSLTTGLRIGDVLELRVENIHGNRLSTVCKKTGKPFECELPPNIARHLLIAQRLRGSLWCFPSRSDREKHRTRQAVWADVKRAAKKCGFNRNVTPHTARKIFAVDTMHEKGLSVVQEVLQHEHIDTSLIYAFADLLGLEKHQKRKKEKNGISPEVEERINTFIHEFCTNLGGAEVVRAALATALDCLS